MRILMINGWAMPAGVLEPLRRSLGVNPEHLYGLDRPLAEVRRQIVQDLQPGSVLIGWSLGGMVALQLAAMAPERITAVVTIATNPKFLAAPDWAEGYDAGTFTAFASRVQQDPAATMARFAALATQGSHFQRDELRWMRALLETERQFPPQVLDSTLTELGSLDLRPVWQELNIPMFSILGQQDALVPAQLAQRLESATLPVEAVRGVNLIEGMAHLPSGRFVEPVAEAVREAILPIIRSWC